MIRRFVILLGGLSLIATTPAPTPAIFDPAQAIQLADSAPRSVHAGQFRMTVLATGERRRVVFLNSMADYRAPGNLTFSMSSRVANQLAERIGQPVLDGMIGKTVIVQGQLERRAIVNSGADGKVIGFNRWGYSVRISDPAQVLSIAP